MNEILHYGVKGMKWGVRKSRKKKNSKPLSKKERKERDELLDNRQKAVEKMTKSATKIASSSSEAISSVKNISDKRRKSKEVKTVKRPTYDLSKMSDKELQQVINRLNMERQLKQLTAVEKVTGYDYAKDILKGVGAVASTAGAIVGLALSIEKLRKGE